MKVIAICLAIIVAAATITAAAKPRVIGMKRATEIASSHVRGKITSKELEKEHGRWIYSFDIATGRGKITEVHVNAYTGKIMAIEHENARKEADEEKTKRKAH